mmetsp:Transcript_26706/g.67315  ORF Transcript_26706/g.67315 Transcript_26706/m.67315 type:complete len:86 (-) Transcript_26706:744-1001(-)
MVSLCEGSGGCISAFDSSVKLAFPVPGFVHGQLMDSADGNGNGGGSADAGSEEEGGTSAASPGKGDVGRWLFAVGGMLVGSLLLL